MNTGMKQKTIKRILSAKFEEFITSIKNDSVKKLVSKNSIITGGSIASMLIGENVNDFDIYFTNKETVLAVADYYLKEFMNLKSKTESGVPVGIHVVDWDNVGSDFQIMEKKQFMIEAGMSEDFYKNRVSYYISSAGVASLEPKKAYEYFEGQEAGSAGEYIDALVKDKEQNSDNADAPKYRPVFLSGNAISLSDDVQLIIRFFGSPEEIHKNYDFAHCTSYWLSSDKKLYTNEKALSSLLAKELSYIGSRYPVTSVIRTRKFINRGWRIHAGNYLKMCFQISELNLYNPIVLEEQLMGVDIAYFMEVIDAIKKLKLDNNDNKIEYTYLAEILDRIFDK